MFSHLQANVIFDEKANSWKNTVKLFKVIFCSLLCTITINETNTSCIPLFGLKILFFVRGSSTSKLWTFKVRTIFNIYTCNTLFLMTLIICRHIKTTLCINWYLSV